MPVYIVNTDIGELEIEADDQASALKGAEWYLNKNAPSNLDLSFLDGRKSKDTGFVNMVGRGVVRGAKQTGSLLADVLPALAASAVGADEYAARQMQEAAETQKEIDQKYAPRYGSYKDVEGLGDVIPFAAETIAEQLPNLATALIPGVGGAAIGARTVAGRALPAIAESVAKRQMTEEAAKKLTQRAVGMAATKGSKAGSVAGAYLGSYALNAPEVFQNIYEATGDMAPGAAILAGSVSAALDSILPAYILNRLTPGVKAGVVERILARKGMQPGLARSITAGAVTGASVEAPTEATQEAISITAEKIISDTESAWNSEDFDRLVESGIRGAVAGGGISGAFGVGEGFRARNKEQEKEELAEQRRVQEAVPKGYQMEIPGMDTDVYAPSSRQLIDDYLLSIKDPEIRKNVQQQIDNLAKSESNEKKRQAKIEAFVRQDSSAFEDERKRRLLSDALQAGEIPQSQIQSVKSYLATPPVARPKPQKDTQYEMFTPEGEVTKQAEIPAWQNTSITNIDDTVIAGLGLGRTKSLKNLLLGKDISNPEQAEEVKTILEGYLSDYPNPSETASKIIPKFLRRKEFVEAEEIKTSKARFEAGDLFPSELAEAQQAEIARQEESARKKAELETITTEKLRRAKIFSGPLFQLVKKKEEAGQAPSRRDPEIVSAANTLISNKLSRNKEDQTAKMLDAYINAPTQTESEAIEDYARREQAYYEDQRLRRNLENEIKNNPAFAASDMSNIVPDLPFDYTVEDYLKSRPVVPPNPYELDMLIYPKQNMQGKLFRSRGRPTAAADVQTAARNTWRDFGPDGFSFDKLSNTQKKEWMDLVAEGVPTQQKAWDIINATPPVARKPNTAQDLELDRAGPAKMEQAFNVINASVAPSKEMLDEVRGKLDELRNYIDDETPSFLFDFKPNVPEKERLRRVAAYNDYVENAPVKDIENLFRVAANESDPKKIQSLIKNVNKLLKTEEGRIRLAQVINASRIAALINAFRVKNREYEKSRNNPKNYNKNINDIDVSNVHNKANSVINHPSVTADERDIASYIAGITVQDREEGRIQAERFGVEDIAGGGRTPKNLLDPFDFLRMVDVDNLNEYGSGISDTQYTLNLPSPKRQGKAISLKATKALEENNYNELLKELTASIDSKVVKYFLSKIKQLNINPTVRIGAVENNMGGEYNPNTDTITYDPSQLNEIVVVHELMHPALLKIIRSNPNSPGVKQLQSLFDQIQGTMSGTHGATNIEEFISELVANPEFQALLKSIKAPKSGSMFKKIIDAIAEMLGIRKGQSAFDVATKTLSELIDISAGMQPTPVDALFFSGSPKLFNNAITSVAQSMPAMNKTGKDKAMNALSRATGETKNFGLTLLRLDNTNDLYANELPSIQKLLNPLELRSGDRRKNTNQFKIKVNKLIKLANKKANKPYMDTMDIMALEARYYDIDLLNPKFKPTAEQQNDYARLKGMYNRLPTDVKSIYEQIVEGYRQKVIEVRDLYMSLEPDAMAKAEIRDKFDRMIKNNPSYVPYTRNGNFKVEYEIDGERHVEPFPSEREQNQFKLFLTSEGITYMDYKDVRPVSSANPPAGSFVSGVITRLRNKKDANGNRIYSDSVLSSLQEMYMETLPASSVMKRFMKTDYVRGMDKDVLGSYADSIPSWINKITKAKYAPDIQKAIFGIKQEAIDARTSNDPKLRAMANDLADVSNIIGDNESYYLNPTIGPWVQAGTQLSYFEFIAGNISSVFNNLMTIPAFTYPILAGEYGVNKAASALESATRIATTTVLSPDSNKSAKNLVRYLDLYKLLESHDQLGSVAENTLADMENNLATKTLRFLSTPFNASERLNRLATAVATFDLAMQGGMSKDKALREALNMTKRINTSGIIDTAPIFAQTGLGGFGRTVYTFKSFIWNQAFVLGRTWYKAAKGMNRAERRVAARQLIGMYGMAMATAGVNGLPFFGAMSVLGDMIASLYSLFDDDDEPFDLKNELRIFFGDMVYKGPLNYYTNLNFSDRIGMATDLIYRDNPTGIDKHGLTLEILSQLFGPSVSVFTQAETAFKDAQNGEYLRAIEAILPTFAGNVVKAFRYAEDGVVTRGGEKVVDDISKKNLFMQALGFSPANVNMAYESVRVGKKLERHITAKKKRILDLISDSEESRDMESLLEAKRAMLEFNRKYPEAAITQSTLKRSRAGRENIKKRLLYGYSFNEKLLPRIKRELGIM